MSSSTSGGSGSRVTSTAIASLSPGSPSDDPTHTTGASPAASVQADEGAGEQPGRVDGLAVVAGGLDRDAGLDHGGGLRLVGDTPHGIRLLERRPRLAGEQPRGDPRGGDEQDEAAARRRRGGAQEAGAAASGATGLIQLGVDGPIEK